LNNIHNDDVAFIEEELKRFKTLQNMNDDEATKRRKEVLTMARHERLKVDGDKDQSSENDEDDEVQITQTTQKKSGRNVTQTIQKNSGRRKKHFV
jgi:hypothetical protein